MLGFRGRASSRVGATAYWWTGRKNFGDELTAPLLARFAGVDATRGTVSESSIVACGSVLEHVPPEWNGFIVGSGRLRPDSQLHTHCHLDPSKILAVRGPFSAAALGVRGVDPVLGDPGLLADELVRIETRKYRLGIVPHWSDLELAHRPEFQEFNPRIIDPSGDPLDVVRAIGECDKIVSSSLHGIIVADSFGLARRFEYCKSWDRDGGLFKYQDYSAAIKARPVVGETIRPSKFHIEDVKDQLWDCFHDLGKRVRRA